MGCTGAEARQGELDFIHSLRDRESPQQCRGPLVVLPINLERLELLEESLRSTFAISLLWAGVEETPGDEPLQFRLCAAHWMDLCYLGARHARSAYRRDWLGEAIILFKQISGGAGWDHREINIMQWQRVRLT